MQYGSDAGLQHSNKDISLYTAKKYIYNIAKKYIYNIYRSKSATRQ